MKLLPFLLLYVVHLNAQIHKNVRQLVALVLNEEPDRSGNPGNYLLLADQPHCMILKNKQTFVLRSAWQKEGDSVVNIGSGTFTKTDGYTATLNATIAQGKKIQKADVAFFFVLLKAPGKDSVISKLARYAIAFESASDSSFYYRCDVLQKPAAYSTARIAYAMSVDIQYTATQMLQQNDAQDQEITNGVYKGKRLFAAMQKTTATDVTAFLMYVYTRPDKYMAHTFKVSETYATWLINGAPAIKN